MESRGRDLNLTARTWMRMGVRRREPVESVEPRVPGEDARVAVLSTGGALAPGQEPFDTGKSGDPTFRTIPSDTDPAQLRWAHPHYDTSLAEEDPDCIFPVRLMGELAADDEIGSLAPTAYSMMGYAPLTRPVIEETAPAVGELMQGEEVDAALLCPA
ncbi:MAG: glycine/sarcosine/betaine reductase selenoprotein B family protein [Candidatus Palauibacterales bacterium]|nr:glycine/sarcosine/betaine reductase selenoprotein B family protein [Candidatus Palauibacterales bacterium]